MISPGEECRSWDASRRAHTVWLCENDGRMGWVGSAGLQLARAHVKGQLSAQGVWAEHLQLCFLILGCLKLFFQEKKWEKLPQVTVTYSATIFSLGWRLSKLLSLEGGAAVVVAVRCWFPAWDLEQMKPWGSNQPIDEWACWDVWTPPPLSKILQEPAEIQSITTSRINTQTCQSCPAFLLSLQLFSPECQISILSQWRTACSLWVIIRSFDLLSLLAHLSLFSSSKDSILLRFCQLVTPHGFYIKFDIKKKNFSSIQTKNKLIFTQIV